MTAADTSTIDATSTSADIDCTDATLTVLFGEIE
jgi:hypothetical protein